MGRTSSVIFSIAFTGFIMLSIAQMGASIDVDTKNGQVKANGHTAKNVGDGLAVVNRDDKKKVDLPNGKIDGGGVTGVKAADGLAGVTNDGYTGVDLKTGKVQKREETTVKVGNVVVGVEADVNVQVPGNTYPAKSDVPKTQNTDGSYN
ncbi:hypothetical protein MKW94_024627 [Papaver nudicaule]|uniref:Uncharacterized protein n=1 Tax=Papaver nudicaule TaxID=74823 RepID=A0AA41RYX7_PAPNU|nr:hypothetical protein [Papaver nudicaule]